MRVGWSCCAVGLKAVHAVASADAAAAAAAAAGLQALVLVEAAQEAQEALEQAGVKLLPPSEDEEAADMQPSQGKYT